LQPRGPDRAIDTPRLPRSTADFVSGSYRPARLGTNSGANLYETVPPRTPGPHKATHHTLRPITPYARPQCSRPAKDKSPMARNKKDSKNKTIAGRPLTPHLLLQLGALRNLPPTPHSFKPEANWLSTYRIWTCHGYLRSGNRDVGWLRIERAAAETKNLAPSATYAAVLTEHREILKRWESKLDVPPNVSHRDYWQKPAR